MIANYSISIRTGERLGGLEHGRRERSIFEAFQTERGREQAAEGREQAA
jgi:hypothetical protein